MADQVTVNLVAVQNILRKLKSLEEEARLSLSEADKTIQNAELEGWNDTKYHQFIDSFLDTKSLFNNAVKRIEEEHIPFLKKVMRAAEEFN